MGSLCPGLHGIPPLSWLGLPNKQWFLGNSKKAWNDANWHHFWVNLTVMKWREKPLIFKHGEWFLCSYYWLTYGLRNILHLKTYHHISSLLSIWSKLEFSWSGFKANILPTKCPLSSIIDDFQRIGQYDFRKTTTCLKYVHRANDLKKSYFPWNDTNWHHLRFYFSDALVQSGCVWPIKVSYYRILEILAYVENPVCEAWASV